jgi:hypothetical protein
VRGSLADYTLPAGDHQGVTLSAPARCDDTYHIDGHYITMRGHGFKALGIGTSGCRRADGSIATDGGATDGGATDSGAACQRIEWDVFRWEIARDLGNPTWLGTGMGIGCSGVKPAGCLYYFSLRDWAHANRVILTIMDYMRQLDLGACVTVIVSGQQASCAH